MKKVIFGIIWYLVIVNVLAFMISFSISFFFAVCGHSAIYSRESSQALFHSYQPFVVIISIIITLVGTIKGFLPGTKGKTK